MNNFIKGYKDDAGVDIVLDDNITIIPGMNIIILPCQYIPAKDEVAFVVPRTSTAIKGIILPMCAIDAGYDGFIRAIVYNVTNETITYYKGDRPFSIVNFKKGNDRVNFTVSRSGERGTNWNNSSGGNV